MSRPKIAVIGLGATGTAALCRLALRGAEAIGIEQFEPGHDRGSSHGLTRMIRLAHFERSSYLPLMRRAYALWRELETIANQQFLHITGIAEIGPASGEVVRGTHTGANSGLAREDLDAATLMRRYPAFRLPEDAVATVQSDGGYIEASRALAAQTETAKAHGAQFHIGRKVAAVEPARGGVRIKIEGGDVTADYAIVAAGPWMASLMPEWKLPLTVTRQVVGWFEPHDPAQFSPSRFPVFVLETSHGTHYGFPLRDGMGLKLAKHHHLGEVVQPDTWDRTVSPQDEAEIRGPLPDYLPAANGRLLRTETCLYTMTPDNTFIIDHLPGCPRILIASPCCGHGFKFSPVIGEILADLVLHGATAHDIAPFRLQRFG